MTGRDIVIAALLGAEEFAFATAPLVVLGCDMMRVCNLDTCPAGIATQNPELRKNFAGKPEYVENLMRFLAEEVREHMARIGVKTFKELIGRVELLRQRTRTFNEKARTIDLSELLYQMRTANNEDERYFSRPQEHRLESSLDVNTLLPLCRDTIECGDRSSYRLKINNTNRTAGCILSSEIVKKYGPKGLKEDTVTLEFDGSAGQSFGAFLINGVTLKLNGEGNDYLGKGCCGGKIIVAPSARKINAFEGQIIIGNVAFYGATAGQAYIRGGAGERFCVRNSGLTAVVEGVGDHACEYMTGGCAVILGETGRNFGAGMSGGTAYVYDPENKFINNCNVSGINVAPLGPEDKKHLRGLLEKHKKYTGSLKAAAVLKAYETESARFVKVIPKDYQRILEAYSEADKASLTGEEKLLYAFNKVTANKE
jgi:glutamate synthase (ferredoxin)